MFSIKNFVYYIYDIDNVQMDVYNPKFGIEVFKDKEC